VLDEPVAADPAHAELTVRTARSVKAKSKSTPR
jgi:hypothetical protein